MRAIERELRLDGRSAPVRVFQPVLQHPAPHSEIDVVSDPVPQVLIECRVDIGFHLFLPPYHHLVVDGPHADAMGHARIRAETARSARSAPPDGFGRAPLPAVELLHAVAVGLDLGRTSADWPQPLHTLDQTLPADLPEAAVGAIRVGFRRLSKPAQEVLLAVAVLGERVPADRLAAAPDVDAERFPAALEELEWERWITAEPMGYSLLARIVQEVILRDMVTAGKRARIEAAAGARKGR